MTIEEINQKLANGELLTKEESLVLQISQKEKEVEEYDFQVESLEIQLQIITSNPERDVKHLKHIERTLAETKRMREIVIVSKSSLEIMLQRELGE